MKRILCIAALAALPTLGSAATLDLNTWQADVGGDVTSDVSWTVGPDDDSVTLREHGTIGNNQLHGRQTVFYDATANDKGRTLSGSFTIDNRLDDDFVGFAFGYNQGEVYSANRTASDFWLVDWRASTQGGAEGMALSHVSGLSYNQTNYWFHDGIVSEKARAETLGDTGWASNTTYAFTAFFSDTQIIVTINGNEEINYTGNFGDGAIGLYGYSQDNIFFEGLEKSDPPAPQVLISNASTSQPAPVPLPAGMPLLLAGLGAFGLMRRKS